MVKANKDTTVLSEASSASFVLSEACTVRFGSDLQMKLIINVALKLQLRRTTHAEPFAFIFSSKHIKLYSHLEVVLLHLFSSKKINCWTKLESCPPSCSISSLGNPAGLHTPGWGSRGAMEGLHIPVRWHNTSHQHRESGSASENNPSFFSPILKYGKRSLVGLEVETGIC